MSPTELPARSAPARFGFHPGFPAELREHPIEVGNQARCGDGIRQGSGQRRDDKQCGFRASSSRNRHYPKRGQATAEPGEEAEFGNRAGAPHARREAVKSMDNV